MWWHILQAIYTHESYTFYKTTVAEKLETTKENLNRYFEPLEHAGLLKIENRPLNKGGRADHIGWTGTGEQLYSILSSNLKENETDFLFDQVVGPLLEGIKDTWESIDHMIEERFLETGEIPVPEDIAEALEISPGITSKMQRIDVSLARFKHCIARLERFIPEAASDIKESIHTETGREQIKKKVIKMQTEDLHKLDEIVTMLIVQYAHDYSFV